jgi:hypothetical protein
MQPRSLRSLAIVVAVTAAACSSSGSSGGSGGGTFAVTTASLPPATTGVAYSAQLASANGTAPVAWSITGSVLPPGLTLDGATGAITGTPTAAASYAFTVTATDSSSPPRTASASLTIDVLSPPAELFVVTTTLPNAVVGNEYAEELAAGGGTQPYAWTVVDGALPAGIALAADGTLSGAPTVSGTFLFTVQVSDSASPVGTATASLGITVLADPDSLQVTTMSLPGGTVDSAYAVTFTASNGTEPYLWNVDAETLPPGLALSSGGTLSGIPTTVGLYTFVVEVTDSAETPESAQRQFTMSVGTAPLTFVTVSLPNGVVGVEYQEALEANGGLTPYRWSIADGVLPDGLVLGETTGVVSGTPTTAAGDVGFTIQVADASDPRKSATQSFQVTISAASQELVITTRAFGDGVVGVAYEGQVKAVGGTQPYAWSVVGALPPGLALDGATGVISGTPTSAGSFPFTVTVSDAGDPQQVASRELTIEIAAP